MREKLIALMYQCYKKYGDVPIGRMADFLIDNGVTIPMKCKECKYFITPHEFDIFGRCTNPRLYITKAGEFLPAGNDFCSYGERKTEI